MTRIGFLHLSCENQTTDQFSSCFNRTLSHTKRDYFNQIVEKSSVKGFLNG